MSETSRHARESNTGTWEAFQPPRPQGRGRQSQGRSRAEDARLEGVGLGHSSEETGEQSSGCAVAESAERRAGRNGSSQQAKHGPDTEPDFPRHRRLRDTAVPKGCRHDRSEEPGALAGTPGSARGASGNRRPTATKAKAATAGVPLSDLLRQAMARTRTWTASAAEVERERTRQVARIGNNLNQIARWANTHADKADAFEVIAHLVAIEREIARLARFADERPDAR